MDRHTEERFITALESIATSLKRQTELMEHQAELMKPPVLASPISHWDWHTVPTNGESWRTAEELVIRPTPITVDGKQIADIVWPHIELHTADDLAEGGCTV